MRKKLLITNYWLLITVFLSGCATLPHAPTIKPEMAYPGVYHRVERGENLWRISKMYDINLEEMVKVNRISDAASIEVGQLILIPHRQSKSPKFTAVQEEDFIWPVSGKAVSVFGSTSQGTINRGLDIKPAQEADVYAARSGKVVFHTDDFQGYGKTIIIDHGDGYMSVYARNNRAFVNVGQVVQKGATIGQITQANNYLHFEIRKGHTAVNPYFYLSR